MSNIGQEILRDSLRYKKELSKNIIKNKEKIKEVERDIIKSSTFKTHDFIKLAANYLYAYEEEEYIPLNFKTRLYNGENAFYTCILSASLCNEVAKNTKINLENDFVYFQVERGDFLSKKYDNNFITLFENENVKQDKDYVIPAHTFVSLEEYKNYKLHPYEEASVEKYLYKIKNKRHLDNFFRKIIFRRIELLKFEDRDITYEEIIELGRECLNEKNEEKTSEMIRTMKKTK